MVFTAQFNHSLCFISKKKKKDEIKMMWIYGFYLLLTRLSNRLIYRLHLCRGVRHPPPNECPDYDTKQSGSEVSVMLALWGMRSTPLLPSLPGPLWSEVEVPIYWSNITKCVLMLNWITWNRTNFISKQRTYAKLIVWNRTVFVIETVRSLNWIVWIWTVWLNWICWNRNVSDN